MNPQPDLKLQPRKDGTSAFNDAPAFKHAVAAGSMAERDCLRLFVSGPVPRSIRAIKKIRAVCDEALNGRYISTQMKKLPLPARQIVGDPSDKTRILAGLDIFR
jgi:hypothetical protein